jgi:hypothetical protein
MVGGICGDRNDDVGCGERGVVGVSVLNVVGEGATPVSPEQAPLLVNGVF